MARFRGSSILSADKEPWIPVGRSLGAGRNYGGRGKFNKARINVSLLAKSVVSLYRDPLDDPLSLAPKLLGMHRGPVKLRNIPYYYTHDPDTPEKRLLAKSGLLIRGLSVHKHGRA